MNKDLKILIVILALVLTATLVMTGLLLRSAGEQSQPTEPESTTTEPVQTTTEYVETIPVTTEQTVPETTEEVTTAPTVETTVPPTTVKPTNPKPTNPKPTTEPEKSISFPYTIPGTNLVIQKVDSYDGVFLEDGSDREVSGICAMVVKNSGSTGVEYAKITLVQGDRTLTFAVTGLRAGAQAVVQEASASAYKSGKYKECTAEVAELAKFEMSESLVQVVENADGTLTVTNLTQQTIPCVRIFYKFCLTPGSVYVGGITYTSKLTDLAPGVPQQVTPSHYAGGYSEVVMVRTYETAE